MRNFFIALKNISPNALRFLRSQFDNRVPSDSTIRNWYANADLNCNTGIIKYSLKVLQRKVDEMAAKDQKLIGALLFDEMAIQKHFQFINNEMVGFENVPTIDRKQSKVAAQVIVFMLNGINVDLKLPVAYYYINKLDGDAKGLLLKMVIQKLSEAGVVVTSVTFDGARENPAMCETLGACLNVYSESFNPSFIVDGKKIYVLFDPSHDVKLVRGTVALKHVSDSNGKHINWNYFQKLVQFKSQRNFGDMAHKMTKEHICFASNPMKVRLAVETLSASCANAMEYLMKQGFSEFRGAESTIELIRYIDDTFNVCNSTKTSITKENILKRPWSAENVCQIREFCERSIEYIKRLRIKTDGGNFVQMCSSQKKTGFQGFIVSMHSLMNIYDDLVNKKRLVSSLTTHSFSQDHLEQYFGIIRSMNGSNNNPTCQQFNAAMRKTLANVTLFAPEKGNCTIFQDSNSTQNPYSNILKITSRKTKSVQFENINMHLTDDDIEPILIELSEIKETNALIDLSDLTIATIALNIERKMEAKFSCVQCANLFHENEKVHQIYQTHNDSRNVCRSTFEICQAANSFTKMELLKGQFDPRLMRGAIFNSLSPETLFTHSNFDDHTNHLKKDIIYDIIRHFIQIKGKMIAKNMTIETHSSRYREKLK